MLLLAFIIVGFCTMFGYLKSDSIYKVLIWLIVGPLLLWFIYNEWTQFYAHLPWWWQVVSLILLPFVLLALLRFFLPKSAWITRLQQAIFDALVFCLTFPIRLVWRAGRQIIDRERHRIRLQRHRPAVGGRPPLRTPERRNINFRND